MTIHKLICTCCKEPFTAKRKDAKTCSPACRKGTERRKAGKPKRKKYNDIERALTNLSKNAFGYWLTGIIRRAGTVEIVPTDINYTELITLYNLHRTCRFSNGLGSYYRPLYNLCHLVPAKTTDRLGILHPKNILIAPACLNQHLGNKTFERELSDTLSIPRKGLLSKWEVSEGATPDSVCELLDTYLGGTLSIVAFALDLKPSKGYGDSKDSEKESAKSDWGMSPIDYPIERSIRHFQRYHSESRITCKAGDYQLDERLTQDFDMYQYLLTGKRLVLTEKLLSAAIWDGFV